MRFLRWQSRGARAEEGHVFDAWSWRFGPLLDGLRGRGTGCFGSEGTDGNSNIHRHHDRAGYGEGVAWRVHHHRPRYTGPITLTATTKLKAIAGNFGYTESGLSEAVYTITAPPQLSAPDGKPTTAQTVTIADATPGAVIYYTTDGTQPTSESTRYTKPFQLVKPSTVKAFAVANGFINSRVAPETYYVNLAIPKITWAAPPAITYGTALGAKQLSAKSSVAGTFSYSPKARAVLPAGVQTLTVTFTPADTNKYAPVTMSVKITVRHATLTVAAVNESVVQGKPIPHLTYTLSGFVNGDNRNRLSGAPVETTTAKQGSKAGTYPITIQLGTLKAANYIFAFKDATLTITP